jgi:hypothetical protein
MIYLPLLILLLTPPLLEAFKLCNMKVPTETPASMSIPHIGERYALVRWIQCLHDLKHLLVQNEFNINYNVLTLIAQGS